MAFFVRLSVLLRRSRFLDLGYGNKLKYTSSFIVQCQTFFSEIPESISQFVTEYPNLILFVITILAVFNLLKKISKLIENRYFVNKEKVESKLSIRIINNLYNKKFIYSFIY